MKARLSLLSAAATVALVGCQLEDVETTVVAPDLNDVTLAVAAESYPTSDIAIISKKDSDSFKVIEAQIHTDNPGDISILIDGEEGYRLGQFGFDNITKFTWSLENETIQVDSSWEYSVQGEDSDANPYSLTKVTDNFAYLTRYGAKSIWQVDLSAENETSFKVAEIDLSAFAYASSGIPNMADAVLVGDKLFVLLQRLNGFAPEGNSSIVVINTADNSIVDTDPSTSEIDAIDLTVRNANGIIESNGNLLVSARGDAYAGFYNDRTNEFKFSGGIVSLNTTSYEVSMVLDDGDETNSPYGNITTATLADSGDIYFIGSFNYGDHEKLYRLAPNAGIAREVTLSKNQLGMSALASNDNDVYVGVHANETAGQEAGVYALTTTRDQSEAFIPMTYNPSQIEVIE